MPTTTILHILTQPKDPLVKQILDCQANLQEARISTFDLTAPKVDYDELLDAIFEASSVQVW